MNRMYACILGNSVSWGKSLTVTTICVCRLLQLTAFQAVRRIMVRTVSKTSLRAIRIKVNLF